jgi:hypothetical protein
MAAHPADSVAIDFLPRDLARDVRRSLRAGITAGVLFDHSGGPEDLFRAAVRRAITAIVSNDKNELLPRFLSVGPFYDSGQIQTQVASKYQSDAEVAAAIRFVFSSAINSFQGQLAEILAVGPVVALARELARATGARRLPRIFAGDSVLAHPLRLRTWAKAADFHLLDPGATKRDSEPVTVLGVVEVKSYAIRLERLRPQLERHIARAQRGLRIQGREVKEERAVLGGGPVGPAQIVVVPATWALPRAFSFVTRKGNRFLEVKPPKPPAGGDRIEQLGPNLWKVTLRWSEEALADSAYAMTFWYMGELGRLLYERDGMPREWSEMTPVEAGQNAVKMMLYYAILRARTVREESRAIALYNSYGFGYALGSSFVDRHGRREVLFPDDLDEILATGRCRTKPIDEKHPAQFCRIRGFDIENVRERKIGSSG